MMLGLMQDQPLLIPRSSRMRHATTAGRGGVATSRGRHPPHHLCRARAPGARLARALQRLDVAAGDRVATLAWNGFRHLELYYGVSGMRAVCHTLNPRLSADDIAFILRDAGAVVLFAETTFAIWSKRWRHALPASCALW